ncbi:efflux RND transporter periplasmic adaptor subunit [Kutzneria buriramensis]|uniref:HlyD family secretion protein n=1 Tax=Kutzneria buriramensis TaxID=1045776 RepID=A0A3E0I9M1_9PSEU|nr:HlyD family efflux transporter periplasmic adaptor subunit [Kutzneria buriramensis]REH55360.1 HlyD family secretion protein [Kutzneria buriramensis]
MADRKKDARRRGFRRSRVVIGIVVLVLLGGGAAAFAATRSSGPSYRTAIAGPASVTSMLNGIGTVQPVSEATVSFPVSGQVASVAVKQGDQVTSGQVLASLNTTTLAGQVSTAQSTLATAQAKLASDQNSQTSAATPSTQSSTPSTSKSSSSGGSSAKLTGLLRSISDGQNAVRGAQQKVDADVQFAGAALKKAQATCPNVIQQLGATPPATDPTSTPAAKGKGGATPPSDGSDPTSTTPTPPPTAPPVNVSDCTDLLQQVQDAQAKTAADETALSQAEASLSTALGQAATAVQQASTSGTSITTGSATPKTSSTPSTGGGGRGGGGSSTPPSADQIAADQASVDAANAQLAANQQNMAAASLVSPIDGTVAQVDIAAGQNASANSSTAKIVIVGAGGNQVTTAVNDNQVGQVKPGQAAAITPDGAGKPLAGKVVSIGALASTTSGGSASFPVTISLDGNGKALFAGSTAAVAITLGSAKAAVTVPTSAVHTVGANSFVATLVDGQSTLKRVTVGVIGATVTQITEGLNAGDEVVLADLSQALPTATTGAGARGLTGGGGGFRQGGAGGGGGAAGGGGRAGG